MIVTFENITTKSPYRIKNIVSNIVGVQCFNVVVDSTGFGIIAQAHVAEFGVSY
jgi:hypothetical protein